MKFLLLLRPVNLVLIALSMYVTKIYIVEAMLTGFFMIQLEDIYQIPSSYELHFALLVFMMILLASGGNIINDYFDVKADRINKPNKTYIDFHIDRKSAIIGHLICTSLAIILAFYLWLVTDELLYIIIASSIAFFLWLYSLLLKKILLIGNLIIAIITASTPLIAYIYFKPILGQYENTSLDYTIGVISFKMVPFYDSIAIVGAFAGLAFITNFIREIVKDCADVEGDKEIGSKSLPILLGLDAGRIIIILLLLVYATAFTAPFIMWPQLSTIAILLYPVIAIVTCLLASVVLLLLSKQKRNFLIVSNYLKIIMFIGMIIPVLIRYGSE